MLPLALSYSQTALDRFPSLTAHPDQHSLLISSYQMSPFMTQHGPFTGVCVTLGKACVERVKINNKNNDCSGISLASCIYASVAANRLTGSFLYATWKMLEIIKKLICLI